MDTWKYESSRKARHKYYQKNKAKVYQRYLIWLKKNPDKMKNAKLKMRYGITLDEYNQMVKSQRGKCGICAEKKKLFVDHCHKTKKVRGLLCSQCNHGLGMFKDNVDFLSKAIKYLI